MLTTLIYFPVKLGLLQLYPAYICYKAIKANDQKQFGSLLTFWVVSILYLAIEYFSDIFLFWTPFYTEIKLILVLWLILPQTQGAALVYTRYLDPFLNKHEQEIDNVLVGIQLKLKRTIVFFGKQCLESLKKTILQTLFNKGHEDEKTEHADTSTAAASTTMTAVDAPVINETDSYIINPYNLFSTLISTTASRFQQPTWPSSSVAVVVAETSKEKAGDATASPTVVNRRKNGKNAINVATENSSLGRTESHESLNSYVNVKDSSSPLSSPESPQQQSSSSGPQQPEQPTVPIWRAFEWSDYLMKFGITNSKPKPEGTTVAEEQDKKQK